MAKQFKGWEITIRANSLGPQFPILEAAKDGIILKSSSLKRLKLKINAFLTVGELLDKETDFV